MERKSKRKLAFGSLSNRFENKGLHPKYEKRGFTHKYPDISPLSYTWEVKQKLKGSVKYELSIKSEELSKTLLHRVDHKLKQRKWQMSILGPCWHDVKNDAVLKFGTFSQANRFPRSKALATPGPGMYGKNHIPQLRLEERTRFKTFSDTPSFHFDNCKPRPTILEKADHLPPNLYKTKTFVDELLSRMVSKRGPYDLFTGARDESSIYGHYRRFSVRYEGGSVYYPSLTERLNNSCNRHKGKFPNCSKGTYSTSAHRGPVKSDSPAPNAYDPREMSKPVNVARFPFDSSVLYARPIKKTELKPPPGRYDISNKRLILGNGWRSVFISKVKRGIPLPPKMSWY